MTCRFCIAVAPTAVAKGDIVGYDTNGDPVMLNVGADKGMALEVDSAEASGLKWVPQGNKESHFLWRWEGEIISGNAYGFWHWGAALHRFAYSSNQAAPYAIGDETRYWVYLEKGTYDCHIVGTTWTDRGQLDIYVDGVNQGTQEWYSGATGYNVKRTTACTVTYSGLHDIRWKVSGNHASSSSYDMHLTYGYFRMQ